jgi:post-segregation antitoxin (ccd killing protein)
MPKVSVYLPDELYREARERRLSISALTQQALEAALRHKRTEQWVERVRARPPRVSERVDTAALLGRVRDEFGT